MNFKIFIAQTIAFNRKQFSVLKQSYFGLIFKLILLPLLCGWGVHSMKKGFGNAEAINHAELFDMPNLPRCNSYDKDGCFDFGYVKDTTFGESVGSRVANILLNKGQITSIADNVKVWDTLDDMQADLVSKDVFTKSGFYLSPALDTTDPTGETTLGGPDCNHVNIVLMHNQDLPNEFINTGDKLAYTLPESEKKALEDNITGPRIEEATMYTKSGQVLLPYIERAILAECSGDAYDIDLQVGSKAYPISEAVMPTSYIVLSMAWIFLFALISVEMSALLTSMVSEKDSAHRTRQALYAAGMSDIVVGLVRLVFHSAMAILMAAAFYVSVRYVFNINNFDNIEFIAFITVNAFFIVALMMFAITVQTFFDQSRTIIIVVVALWLVGLIFVTIFLVIGWFLVYHKDFKPGAFWDNVLGWYPGYAWALLSCLATGYGSEDPYTGADAKGFTWEVIWRWNRSNEVEGWPVVHYFYLLTRDSIVFAIVAWILCQVIGTSHGGSASLIQLIKNLWMRVNKRARYFNAFDPKKTPVPRIIKECVLDDDYRQQCEDIHNLSDKYFKRENGNVVPANEEQAVILHGINKIYRPLIRLRKKTRAKQVHADKDIYLCLKKDTVTSILGRNGCGKSTLNMILTGNILATSGDGFINGHLISTDMSEIRRTTGYCPQFDSLFPSLTCMQHMYLFCGIRGKIGLFKGKKEIHDEAVELLSAVGLGGKVMYRRSADLSGGMRRRLSLAISLIGNPTQMIGDEVSGALSPSDKSKIWDLVNKFKKDRTTLLTTHSMLEAGYLSDTVAIMNSGVILVCADQTTLKKRHSKGLRIVCDTEGDATQGVLARKVHDIQPEIHLTGMDNDDVDFNGETEISGFAAQLEFTLPSDTQEDKELLLKVMEFLDEAMDFQNNNYIDGFKSYVVHHSSLEEVFLLLTEKAEMMETGVSVSRPLKQ